MSTGAMVLQRCAKPSRLSAKNASLQNRRKPMVLGPDSLARNRRYVSLSAPPAAEGQKRLIEPFSGGASPVPSRAPPGPLPDGSCLYLHAAMPLVLAISSGNYGELFSKACSLLGSALTSPVARPWLHTEDMRGPRFWATRSEPIKSCCY